jgi:hypothetical protein
MENPFESGHIKNYLLLYASVVVIMILFFIASSLFNEIEDVEKREFQTEKLSVEKVEEKNITTQEAPSRFKLLDSSY